MPLLKGDSNEVKKKNFEEFGKGKTYAHTRKKFGVHRADKQRVAVVLQNANKSDKGK